MNEYKPRKFDREGRVAYVLVKSGAAFWCYVEGMIASAKARRASQSNAPASV